MPALDDLRQHGRVDARLHNRLRQAERAPLHAPGSSLGKGLSFWTLTERFDET